MILVTGGLYQGKTEYVMDYFEIKDSDFKDGGQSIDSLKKARCISHFENFVRFALENNNDPIELTKQLVSVNLDVIIVMTEIGSGIVPLEKSERIYREAVGKTGCLLANQAKKVIRLICGIPMIIKEEMIC